MMVDHASKAAESGENGPRVLALHRKTRLSFLFFIALLSNGVLLPIFTSNRVLKLFFSSMYLLFTSCVQAI